MEQEHEPAPEGQPDAVVVDVEMDAVGNLVCAGALEDACELGNDGPEVTRYGYDARSRLRSMTVEVEDETTYTYLPDGRLEAMTLPNGLEMVLRYHDELPVDVQPVGDGTNRVYDIRHVEPGQTPVVAYTYGYGYHRGGQRASEGRRIDGTTTVLGYGYDGLNRLTSLDEDRGGPGDLHKAYTYAPGSHDRATETWTGAETRTLSYAYNAAHQLRSVTDGSSTRQLAYVHDRSGNLQSRAVTGDAGPDETTAYVFDGTDLLVRVTRGPPSDPTTTVLGSYDYDAQRMRIREWDSTPAAGTGRERFYFQRRVLEEHGITGVAAPYRYRWANGSLVSMDREGQRGYVHADLLGTTAAVSDALGGVAGTWETDAWGNAEAGAGNDSALGAQRHVFTGHVHDAATGLVYMRGRFYDPVVGLFVSQDLLPGRPEDPRSQHGWLYAHGNPIANFDPTGLMTEGPDAQSLEYQRDVFHADFGSATEESIERISDDLQDVADLDQLREEKGNPCYPVVCLDDGTEIRPGESARQAEIRALQSKFRGLSAYEAGIVVDNVGVPDDAVVGDTVQIVLADEHVELIEQRFEASLRARSSERIAPGYISGKGTVELSPAAATAIETGVIAAEVASAIATAGGVGTLALEVATKRLAQRGILLTETRAAQTFERVWARVSGRAGGAGGDAAEGGAFGDTAIDDGASIGRASGSQRALPPGPRQPKALGSGPEPARVVEGDSRFVVEPNGTVVDTRTTPRGSFDQPNRARTDILQREDHGAGHSHTHDPIFNTNPRTGGTFLNGRENGRPVTAEELGRIQSGHAPRSRPRGRR